MRKTKRSFQPDRIGGYFLLEWRVLVPVALSGLLYNLGLPILSWFEGEMAQCLADILGGDGVFGDMAVLAAIYLAAALTVQGARFVKRFYVRRFANNVNRRMKGILYANLVRQSRGDLARQSVGEAMTRAISDVDDCAEGMRKFTTELFDTGVAIVGYTAVLVFYNWHLALLSLLFTALSYLCAGAMKRRLQQANAARKAAAASLSAATVDRAENAVTYRIYGCESVREAHYDAVLESYERAAVRANVWQSTLPPLYQVLNSTGVLMILYVASRDLLRSGWNIAAFITFLSCYGKLSTKASKAARLLGAVQRAEVSWKRIKPLLKQPEPLAPLEIPAAAELELDNLSFTYGGAPVFAGLCLTARPGEFIGITGPVACGKSTLGRVFLCEQPYGGSVRFGGRELANMMPRQISAAVGYLGHDPELWNDTVEENVLCGSSGSAAPYLALVGLDGEVEAMEHGAQTVVGSGGVRLSGGQAQRLALARTLAHPRPVLILDDPFSALDRATEDKIFANLREYARDKIVLLISHRLYHFPELTKVIFMEDGRTAVGTHASLYAAIPAYRSLYNSQTGGEENEKEA